MSPRPPSFSSGYVPPVLVRPWPRDMPREARDVRPALRVVTPSRFAVMLGGLAAATDALDDAHTVMLELLTWAAVRVVSLERELRAERAAHRATAERLRASLLAWELAEEALDGALARLREKGRRAA